MDRNQVFGPGAGVPDLGALGKQQPQIQIMLSALIATLPQNGAPFDGRVMDAMTARTAPVSSNHIGGRHDHKLADKHDNLARSLAAAERVSARRRDEQGGGA